MKNLRVAGSCKAWKERDSDRVRSLFMESKLVIVGGFAVRISLEMKSKLEHLFLYNLTFTFFSFFVSFLFRVYIYILKKKNNIRKNLKHEKKMCIPYEFIKQLDVI